MNPFRALNLLLMMVSLFTTLHFNHVIAIDWPLLLCESPFGLFCPNIRKIPTKWPTLRSSKIPYIVSGNFSEQERLMIGRTIDQFNTLSCVKLVSLDPKVIGTSSFVNITKSELDVCTGTGGYNGGEHFVRMHSNCLAPSESGHIAGSMVHELMHVLGFVHEHQRADRDEFVMVRFDRIVAGEQRNFRKFHSKVLNNVDEYDYYSIMHYELNAFADELNVSTIVVTNGEAIELDKIGTRRVMTELDVIKLNKAYICEELYCAYPNDNSTATFVPGSKVTQSCPNQTILLGSITRQCLHGGSWTGVEAKCVDSNELVIGNLNYCNFEGMSECHFIGSNYWKVTPVYSLPILNIKRDLTFGDITGTVLSLNVSQALSNWDNHQLRTIWFPMSCQKNESSFHFCVSFGYFLSTEQVHLRVSEVTKHTENGNTTRYTQKELFGSYYQRCLSGNWNIETFVLNFTECGRDETMREMSFVFEVSFYRKTVDLQMNEHLVALDEVSVHRNGQCHGVRYEEYGD